MAPSLVGGRSEEDDTVRVHVQCVLEAMLRIGRVCVEYVVLLMLEIVCQISQDTVPLGIVVGHGARGSFFLCAMHSMVPASIVVCDS